MPQKQPPEVDSGNLPGGVVPDRTAVPDPTGATIRRPGVAGRPPHGHANTVEGLDDPDVEPQAPGRPTHGANNNP